MTQEITNAQIGRGIDSDTPTVVFDYSGEIVHATEGISEVIGWEVHDLVGSNGREYISGNMVTIGRKIERLYSGEENQIEITINGKSDEIRKVRLTAEPLTDHETDLLQVEFELLNVVDGGTEPNSSERVETDLFENIDSDRLEELGKNIRIDSPEGEMPLNLVMMDLIVGHNEVEQHKKGALALYSALDERLMEEQDKTDNKETVELLKEVKEAAFGLYLRIQRGDLELHGDRDGKYSGYYKN